MKFFAIFIVASSLIAGSFAGTPSECSRVGSVVLQVSPWLLEQLNNFITLQLGLRSDGDGITEDQVSVIERKLEELKYEGEATEQDIDNCVKLMDPEHEYGFIAERFDISDMKVSFWNCFFQVSLGVQFAN